MRLINKCIYSTSIISCSILSLNLVLIAVAEHPINSYASKIATINSYCNAMKMQDYDRAFECFSKDSAVVDIDRFVQDQQLKRETLEISYEIVKSNDTPENAVSVVLLQFSYELNRLLLTRVDFLLSHEEQYWKIKSLLVIKSVQLPVPEEIYDELGVSK